MKKQDPTKDSIRRTDKGVKYTTVGMGEKWNDSIPTRAYKLCLLGLTNEELSVAFGVSAKTIEHWIKTKERFRNAVRLGRQQADAEIAHALYKRAKGYQHPDVHIAVNKGQVIVTDIVKHYPPDTTAAMFWLKNRQRDRWADVWKIEHSLVEADDERNSLEDFSDKELNLMEKLGLQSLFAKADQNNTEDAE